MGNLCQHLRRVEPQVRAGKWHIRCDCGWLGSVAAAGLDPIEAQQRLNRLFIAHVPEADRRLYVLVDQRPGHEGNWIMPEGLACDLKSWWEDDGDYLAEVCAKGVPPCTLPVAEIRCSDGRVFRTE